jgi:hypothetical protein
MKFLIDMNLSPAWVELFAAGFDAIIGRRSARKTRPTWN